jgi:hypothetical protein
MEDIDGLFVGGASNNVGVGIKKIINSWKARGGAGKEQKARYY